MSTPKLEVRNTQTELKHYILQEYLDIWAGIIIQGMKRYKHQVHLVYVDGFAHTGRYTGNARDVEIGNMATEPVYGSPMIGIRALDKAVQTGTQWGVHIRANCILTEKKSQPYEALHDTLELAEFADRTRETDSFESLKPGQIAVLNCDFHSVLPQVLEYTSGYTFAFYLLDPYGPTGIPYEHVVKPVVQQDHTDVMINFPYLDLHRRSGLLKTIDISQSDNAILENHTAMFGTDNWRKVFSQAYNATTDSDVRKRLVEEALVSYYGERLHKANPKAGPKKIPLLFPDKERTMYYLFLTTSDPNGSLRLNEVLYEAKGMEEELRQLYRQSKSTSAFRKSGQQDFLNIIDQGEALPREKAEIDVDDLAKVIYDRFRGEETTFLDVLAFMADSDYHVPHIRRAMTRLKQSERVQYQGSFSNTLKLTFG